MKGKDPQLRPGQQVRWETRSPYGSEQGPRQAEDSSSVCIIKSSVTDFLLGSEVECHTPSFVPQEHTPFFAILIMNLKHHHLHFSHVICNKGIL